MIISGGIQLTSGSFIATNNSPDGIFSLLVTNQAISAYNAAQPNTWVTVLCADYFNIQNKLASVKAAGMTNTQLLCTFDSGFAAGYATITSQQASSAVAGSYIVAFAARPGQINSSVFPLYSYTYEGLYSTAALSASNGPNIATNSYFVLKQSNVSLSANGFVSVGMTSTSNYLPPGSSPFVQYINASSHYDPANKLGYWGPSSWTGYTGAWPYFQMLTTTNKQW